jgi:protocatechuate 3,4-dioxygenase, beta subunit
MKNHRARVLAVLTVLYFVPGLLFCGLAGLADDRAGSAVLVSPDEPGEPLQVSGTVFGSDGATPLAGVELYVYHTDAEGAYSPGTDDNANPRLKATLRTDASGRYELRTIRPAPYPGGGVPAHIHYVVEGAGYPEQRFEVHFEGDPYLSERMQASSREAGRFGSIRPVEVGDDGVSRVTFDLRLRR